MKTLIDEFFNEFPFTSKVYYYSTENQEKPNNFDPRLEWFKKQNYDSMTSTIDDLEKLVGKMKKIRKTKLDKEIQETEEKLKKLKNQ